MEPTRETQEKRIIALLKEDPQKAIVLMVEHYTGLLWTVSRRYLSNPEDIKECVNDTFTEFYLHRERFDETKTNLATYLSAIARHLAISHYRSNRLQETLSLLQEGEASTTELQQAEDRMDLENAIHSLKEEDAAIIRMKYYDGMTIQEIADSLKLPYETVKKRHQRSLKKMRLLLLTLLLLAFILVACACKIMQYFGIIPGYGINTSTTMPFYILENPVTLENDEFLLRLEHGILSHDTMVLTLYAEFKDAWYESRNLDPEITEDLLEQISSSPYPGDCVLLLENGTIWSDICLTSVSNINPKLPGQMQLQITFEPAAELSLEQNALPMILRFSWGDIPFVFCAAREEELQSYSYSLTEQGGLMAIPYLEAGRLYIDIYPLNCGGYTTDPGLVRSIYETVGGPTGRVTVTDADGSEHPGQCLDYRPYSSNAFFRWDFGPAQEGEFVLHVPYVYQTALLPEDFSFSVSDAKPGIGQQLEVPGSCLTIASYSREQPEETSFAPSGDRENPALRRFLCFDIKTAEKDRILAGMSLQCHVGGESSGQFRFYSCTSLGRTQEDYMDFLGYTILLPENYTKEEISFYPAQNHSTVTYRWNHAFSIPFRIDMEKTE